MEMWIDKIWLYGGWFYLTLLFAVLFSLILPLKRLIVFSSLVLALIIGFSFYVKGMRNFADDWQKFRLPYQVKLNQAAFGQIEFAGQLERALPFSAKGCLYWSWDVPTRLLIQRLYPRSFVPIEEGARLEKCPYLISQFKPRELVDYQLILASQAGYLYQRL